MLMDVWIGHVSHIFNDRIDAALPTIAGASARRNINSPRSDTSALGRNDTLSTIENASIRQSIEIGHAL